MLSPITLRDHLWARVILVVVAGIAALRFASPSPAADFVAETMLTELSNPSSVAVRPITANSAIYEVLVYDRGAGRILAVRNNEPMKTIEVIKGLESDDGPAILYVLDDSHLVVTGAEAFLAVYPLTEPGQSLSADESTQKVEAGDDVHSSTARRINAVARTRANDHVPDMLIVAATGDSGPGQLLKIPIRADTLGELTPLNPQSKSNGNSVTALAVSDQGFIVAAESASPAQPAVCHIAFYNPIDGSRLLRLPVELRTITGMAFSPVSGNLYVTGTAPGIRKGAGIYRIDDRNKEDERACEAVKITDIDQSTSLAFAADGALYVTTAGDADSNEKGTLQKITGDF
jgi:hypothetical protein